MNPLQYTMQAASITQSDGLLRELLCPSGKLNAAKVVYQSYVVAFSPSLSMVASYCLFCILFTSFSLSHDR